MTKILFICHGNICRSPMAEFIMKIVVPLIRNNRVVAVLDIDSKDFNTFDETDQLYLEKIAEML